MSHNELQNLFCQALACGATSDIAQAPADATTHRAARRDGDAQLPTPAEIIAHYDFRVTFRRSVR